MDFNASMLILLRLEQHLKVVIIHKKIPQNLRDFSKYRFFFQKNFNSPL